MSESSHVLRVQGLAKRYAAHEVLSDVALQVAPGEVVALRGPNGCGKSTLLGCCSGAVIPDAGAIEIGGHPLKSAPLKARNAMRVLPQQSELPPGLTGAELLDFWAQVYRATTPQLEQARKLADLGEALSRLATTYSVGMRRRLHFALLVMGDAQLFMLDEPFAGVDGPSRARLSEWLQVQSTRGVGMLVAAHDADEGELQRMGAREFWLTNSSSSSEA